MKKRVRPADRSPKLDEMLGVLILVCALATLLALLSYSSTDATWFTLQPDGVPRENWIGWVGATLAEALLQLFGVVAFALPLFVTYVGWQRIRPPEQGFSWTGPLGHLALLLALSSLLELAFDPVRYGGEVFLHPGGYIGGKIAAVLRSIFNTPGAVIFSLTVVISVMILTTRVSFVRSAQLAYAGALAGRDVVSRAVDTWRQRRPAPRVAREAALDAPPTPPAGRPASADGGPQRRPTIALKPAAGKTKPEARATAKPTPGPRQQTLPMEKGSRGYTLPPVELLNEPETQSRESERELLERAEQITEKLGEFNIDGSVVAIHPGPVVTTFEFKPEAGVKYSKITGMTDDLSLALRAESVRIDRMAGRSTVGIEVPNRQQETIFPRELIDSERFRATRSKLALALGKDIHGDVFTAELDRMPHLLIAGATGAGKSVGLNGMIVSLLYKATPQDLRFIMIDTKMIELGVYAEIPHLLIPVVTEPKKASAALQWAVREMERRYKQLAAVGVRNIAQFNALLEEEPGRTMDDPKGGEPIPLQHLPYIVIIIDEMADLMMVSSADVEESVMRLAQMARAVGLHLILATQRPSVDVITGTIKANFPSRIAFRVSQRVDSRTIIDRQGAEHLLGRGDMLLLLTGSARLLRMHSGFITEPEINRITSYLKKMAEPVYDETVLQETEEGRGPGGELAERDEMFVDAVRCVIQEGKCSITLIQRRLQLGYARAARIVDMMEQEGVVSPGEGSKPREVLVGREYLEDNEAP